MINSFSTSTIQIPKALFTEIEYVEFQEVLNNQNNLEKEELSWRTHVSRFILNHKAVRIKRVLC